MFLAGLIPALKPGVDVASPVAHTSAHPHRRWAGALGPPPLQRTGGHLELGGELLCGQQLVIPRHCMTPQVASRRDSATAGIRKVIDSIR